MEFAMKNTQINYKSLHEENVTLPDTSLYEGEDTPRTSGVLVHTVPEKNKARWNHIQDLDSFFTKMYQYHQKHGFVVIITDEIFRLIEFTFVVFLLTFTIHCLNYDRLFGNVLPSNHTRTSLSDVIYPMEECSANFGRTTYVVLIITSLYLATRAVKVFYNITQYWDIKRFYNTVLNIEDNDLDNITWYEIKKKIREVQSEQHMCIDKEQLTDLDIYHRILRFKNYMVALMNKNLLPVKYVIPLYGEVVGLSHGLLFNIDLILFRSPGSPFQNNWQLRDDYSVRGNQVELARRLSKKIVWVALGNFVLAPFIFVWQLVYFSFTYANVLRKEPGALGVRMWSNYGRLHLRHFNELDHELDARLNRAYEYADKYLSSFSSPLLTVIARNILFITGGLIALLLILGIYSEYVFQIEHVLTILTILSVIGLICRNVIPDDNLIWCPEQLMTAILAHVHYLPNSWKNKSHTLLVQKEFGHFFQFKASYCLNEILSPLLTPFILIFVFRPKALEIVKFFRSFTVFVRGVGNVCSFAQMDVRKYGNKDWQSESVVVNNNMENDMDYKVNSPLENGKIELSLLRFTLTNPEWQVPPESLHFISGIRNNALADLSQAQLTNDFHGNPLTDSLILLGSIKNEYSSLAQSLLEHYNIRQNYNYFGKEKHKLNETHRPDQFEQMLQQNLEDKSQRANNAGRFMITSFKKNGMKRLRTSKLEGRLQGPANSILTSLQHPDTVWSNHEPSDLTIADMCLSALYLHEIHNHKKKTHDTIQEVVNASITQNLPGTTTITTKLHETTPLLGIHS